MKIDDSFKKPGAVPFKWEIKPGVPKLQNPSPPSDHDHHFHLQFQNPQNISFPKNPPKLKPPPAGSYHFQPEPQTHSFGSSPRTRSLRLGMAQPEVVSSAGCFASPLVKRKNEKKKTGDQNGSGFEPEYNSDLDIQSRWSVSSRRSVSPLSSSFASYRSSPQQMGDAEWAAFGLF